MTERVDPSRSAPIGVRVTESLALTEADLAEVHDLRLRAADFFDEVGDPPPTPATLQDSLHDVPVGYTRAHEVLFRAYRGGRLLGYAHVLRGYAHPGQWIIGLALVDASERGAGVGRALVDAVALAARAHGARSLAAAVIVSRERALRFWRREGFSREAKRGPLTVAGVATAFVRLERDLDGGDRAGDDGDDRGADRGAERGARGHAHAGRQEPGVPRSASEASCGTRVPLVKAASSAPPSGRYARRTRSALSRCMTASSRARLARTQKTMRMRDS